MVMVGTQAGLLEEEFAPELIKELPKAGRKLSYVPVAEVITRLNHVLGTGGWSYHVTRLMRDDVTASWVIAEVEIKAMIDGESATRTGVGGYDTSKKGMDVADGYKSAVSEALKKAAQALGVGLHLSRSEEAMAMDAAADQADPEAIAALIDGIKSHDSDRLNASIKSFASEQSISWASMNDYELESLKLFVDAWVGTEATDPEGMFPETLEDGNGN